MNNSSIPIYDDPAIIDFADKQLHAMWFPDEIKVEKDVQDVLVNMTESEKHAVVQTLRLFSLMEISAGDEYWGNRYKKIFDSADHHRAASVFSMTELAVHAPFYNKINELLHLNSREFYESYKKDEVLLARMSHIGAMIDDPDDLVSVGSFTLVEGSVLYSMFGFLKHFQSQGKNQLLNVVRGISFSVRDENIHHMAGAYSFRKLAAQRGYSKERLEQEILPRIIQSVELIYAHEDEIIENLFEKGPITGITPDQLRAFVKSRLDECLVHLGFSKHYNVTDNPVAEWFYKGINDYKFADFFTGQNNQYSRKWDENDFDWIK